MKSDGGRYVTERELEDFKAFLEEKFKSQSNRFLLYLGAAVGLIRFDLPTAVTATAITAAVGKAAWVLVFRH